MISVRNHQRLLSGNKFLAILLYVAVAVTACTPRAKVLKPSGEGLEEEPVVIEVEADPAEDELGEAVRRIALLLPFELNRSAGDRPTASDVNRAALALDFYQGFQLGLEKIAEKGGDFRLDILDSRDNEQEAARLARLESVQEAELIVGPIFPKEIKAFGEASRVDDGKVLQVSPLAATMPTEFNLPNLVSVTSPIKTHIDALAKHIAQRYRPGQVVLLYHTEELSSRQFLPSLKEALAEANEHLIMKEVDGLESLRDQLRSGSKHLIVTGSTNRFRIVTIVDQLKQLGEETGIEFQLFGHPNWAKIPLSIDEDLADLQTVISSSYYIDERSPKVREFRQSYQTEFGVEPSEFAIKGYDAGRFFGGLLVQYGDSYAQHLSNTPFEGLHNTFDFQFYPHLGFVNTAIHFLIYRDGDFRPMR